MINLSIIGYEKYSVSKSGDVFSFNNNKFKTIKTDRFGYKRVFLSKNSKKSGFLVHRLVALAYIPNPNNLPQINHIDGDKTNNHISNLEWVTSKENINHALENRLRDLQEFRLDRSIPDETVHTICRMIGEGYRNIDIARTLGIERHVVKNIKSGTQYKDIVSQYSFIEIIPSKRRVSNSKLEKICAGIASNKSDFQICKENNITEEILNKIRGGSFMPDLVNRYLDKTVATTIETT